MPAASIGARPHALRNLRAIAARVKRDGAIGKRKSNREPEGPRDAVNKARRRIGGLGGDRIVGGIAQHVAAAPDRLDVVLTAGGCLKLLAQLTDEDVDDLE